MPADLDTLTAAADLCDREAAKDNDPEMSNSLALVFRIAATEIGDGYDSPLLGAIVAFAEHVVREIEEVPA